MSFLDRFNEHLFHRANWWSITILVWVIVHWKFGLGGEFKLPASGFPPLVLLVSYFTLSPALFYSLAGVSPYTVARSWGYLVEAIWPIYVLDHIVNLVVLTWLYWLLGAPFGWGMFLPITQTVYLTFYAARGYLRRIGYNQFDHED